jgi:hypothetical protein
MFCEYSSRHVIGNLLVAPDVASEIRTDSERHPRIELPAAIRHFGFVGSALDQPDFLYEVECERLHHSALLFCTNPRASFRLL